MGNPTNFPNRPFRLQAYVWLHEQNIAANTSTVGYSLWIYKNSYSPTSSGATSWWRFAFDGAQIAGANFTYNMVSTSELLLVSGYHTVAHNADGTRTLPFGADADVDIMGYAAVDGSIGLPTIPRASVASIAAPFTRDVGSAITINTNRASASFTHTLKYTFGAATGTIATGVGASTSWTPPMALLNQIPNTTSALVTITTETYSGATLIGTTNSQFTLAAGAGVVPTISGLTASDDNPTVASEVGLFVQSLSILKATVNASGVYGSTITSRSFKMGAVTAASGGVIPITSSGTVAVTASAKDSRSRTGSFAGSISVLPYAQPQFTTVLVRRCDAGGTLNDSGISLRVDLNCAVQSLVNSTERNSLTIRVYTRPYGGTTWTARNVINHTAVSYNSSFVISGGANYPIDESFDVRVEVADKFNTAAAQTVVATAAVFMHWSKTGVGVGKFHENGTLDVAGDIYQSGNVVVDLSDAATNAETQTGTATNKFVTPASLSARTATETRTGIAEIVTQAEMNGGTDDSRIVTAEKVKNAGWLPYAMAAGEVLAGGNTTGATVITFPASRFSQVPRISVALRAFAVNVGILVNPISATQATVVTYNTTSGANVTGVPFHWTAVQMTSSSGSG